MHVARTHISVTFKYLFMTALAVVVYTYLLRLPQATGIISPASLWQTHGNIVTGLKSIWLIFAWGFGIQSLIQIVRVVERKPRDAGLTAMLKHGAWLSAHAGLFEEIIFRLYAFLSFIILLKFLNPYVGGIIQWAATNVILPVANFVTWNTFTPNFSAANWSVGLAIIIGSLFFRSAHIHYGAISKLNVWVIGLVMFWLTLHYGLPTAIIAHFLYDFCVFAAIALTAPLQPRAEIAE